MGADPVRCLKYKTYESFDFLKDVAGKEERCVPVKNDSYCAILAVRGKKGDGIVRLHCRNPRNQPLSLLTENGDLYMGLTWAQSKDFVEGKLKLKPSKTIDKEVAQSFFIKMFGGEEFTPAVKKEVCAKKDCTPPPSEYGR